MTLKSKHGFLAILLPLMVICDMGEAVNRKTIQRKVLPLVKVGEVGKTRIPTDFDSLNVYQSLNFQPSWLRDKLFWKSKDFDFEARYKTDQTCSNKASCELPFLDVIVVPFSHNDPGWTKTYDEYFDNKTSHIISNAVTKLREYPDMTFVWSEISYLSKWWNSVATSEQRQALKALTDEGRLEILTGAWVMTDEASVSLFSMTNQLIEGHDWLRNTLNYKPKTAWSIDPFGHGSVMPYLLKSSGMEGMLIQRLHYAIKHWLAEHKNGDFVWKQRWDSTGEHSLHCLSHPYDLYPTKHSCGPTPEECMSFNFRNLTSLYPWKGNEEQLRYMKPVTENNVQELADRLMGQYRRTASLTLHNTVVTGLGNDFEFDEFLEWDQQYENYNKLFDFINSNPERYNARVGFGTLSQYFESVQSQGTVLPNFKGDYFPYSDAYFAYAPAYWTGYFGTRPFFKKLARETEDELRKAEILFTYTVNYLRQHNIKDDQVALAENYSSLVQARRWLALFAHHDGITGTSPRKTMLDYLGKLHEALQLTDLIQTKCVKLLINRQNPDQFQAVGANFVHLKGEGSLNMSTESAKKIVLFNSLGWKRPHLVRTVVDTPNVVVTGPSGEEVTAQTNPKIDFRGIHENIYEVTFMAHLVPLGFTTYEIKKAPDTRNKFSGRGDTNVAIAATVKCRKCGNNVAKMEDLFYTLKNERIEVLVESETGMITQILRKPGELMIPLNIKLGKYGAEQRGGGAYLSNPTTTNPVDILDGCRKDNSAQVFLVSGPVIHEVVVLCKHLMVSTHILQEGSTESLDAVYLTNAVKPGLIQGSSNGEYFLRFETDLKTVERSSYNQVEEPVFYSDNGMDVEKRMHVSRLPYQGNLYPVVNYAYMEDIQSRKRFSVLFDRAHGFISEKSGHLETVFDRQMPYDDARGMDEGVKDPEDMVSNYVLMLEPLPERTEGAQSLPTLQNQRLSKFLNNQPSLFAYDSEPASKNLEMSIFKDEFPSDVFLLNLRTTLGQGSAVVGQKSSLILQNLGHISDASGNETQILGSDLNLNHSAEPCDLTGNKIEGRKQEEIKTSQLSVGKPFELKSYTVSS